MAKTVRVEGMGRRGPLPRKRKVIAAWLRHEIVRGAFTPGQRIPDRKALIAKFGSNATIVNAAVDELVADGFLRTVSGHGTFVAERIPCADRFLLVLQSDPLNAGVNLFAPALEQAAKEVSSRRGVTFEVERLVDEPGDSLRYAQTLEDVERHRYAGVFLQAVTDKEHDLRTITNLDGIPMAYFGRPSVYSQGSLAVPLFLPGHEGEDGIFKCYFGDIRKRGLRKLAFFGPVNSNYASERTVRRLAEEFGLEIVPNGYHCFRMDQWDPVQARRIFSLFLASDAGRAAEAVVLEDDNMLAAFVEVCRQTMGRQGPEHYLLLCRGNFPLCPKTSFPVRFHGMDLVALLSDFVDYARNCRKGRRRSDLQMKLI